MMPNFTCPQCNSEVIFYDTNEDETKGRYKCPNCRRDTTWKQIKRASLNEVISRMKKITDKWEG